MLSWSGIVGARNDDKGRALEQVLTRLRSDGLQLSGFYQERVLDRSGEVAGWDVVCVGTGQRAPLARRSAEPELCEYAFEPSGFGLAAEWSRKAGAEVVVVGGLGKLEAAGGGHWPLVAAMMQDERAAHALLCIRDSSLSSIAFRLPDPVAHVQLPCEPSELTSLSEAIADRVRRLH